MILLDDFSQLQLHGGMAACSYTSWWFLTTSTSVEAIFQSYTLPYNHHANFESCTLPIISLTSNPPLLVTKTSQNFQSSRNLTKTSYENFSNLPILHFWLRNLTKTSYENFSKLLSKTSQNFQSCTLPILSQSYENFLRKLPIPPLLVTKTWNFQSSRKLPFPPTWKLEKSPLLVTKPRKLLKTFYENFFRKLLKTSNPTLFQYSTFGYENLKLPVPPTWKLEKPPILHSSYNFQFLHFWLRKLETSNPLANFWFLQLENL